MEDHHKAWIDSHKIYDEAWFRLATKAGFEIHHLDGDFSNNEPDNLILIEGIDHQKLHGRNMSRLFGDRGSWITEEMKAAKALRGKERLEQKAYSQVLGIAREGRSLSFWGHR